MVTCIARTSVETRRNPHALGLVFKMYSNTFPGSIPVGVSGNSPQPEPKYPPAPDQPKASSGSPTYPLDVFAALTPDRKFLCGCCGECYGVGTEV